MSKAEQQVELLRHLAASVQSEDSSVISASLNWEHDVVVGVLKSLEMMGKVRLEQFTKTAWSLTGEGSEIVNNGKSWEMALLEKLPLSVDAIKADAVLQRVLGNCLKQGWVKKTGATVELVQMPKTDELLVQLQSIDSLDDKTLAQLQKRKLVAKSTRTLFVPYKTEAFSTTIKQQLVDIDRSILQSGEWRNADFKPYNWNAAGLYPLHGSVHPLMKTMSQFRQILQQMAFEEMDTRRWVESCFWNFDALFQPQTHPVRDAHDTFFLRNPQKSLDVDAQAQLPLNVALDKSGQTKAPAGLENISNVRDLMSKEYFERVRKIHQSGDHESLGWEFPWSEEESYKLILRTHTTAVTSRMLRRLALEHQQNPEEEINKRYFSIDRVFRNETLDATHLAEFHQVEGIVASTTSSLSQLMGIIKTFFAKIGIDDVMFKPAYNPYTEPSMEIFGYHPTLKKLTEIGNSGVFRPEMLRPMGLPENLIVLGWGLSLERPTMINNAVDDIRELIGPKAKLTVF